ncbi:MAG: Gfo/Idh/MocA family protein [Phycisphaerae bacterium]
MTVRIGLVGLGMMGRTHLAAYADIPEAEVVALCDSDADRLAGGHEAAVDARKTGDYRELIDDSGIDAVDLCVPTCLHATMTIDALQAGKHVFCEKPMAPAADKAAAMLAAARDSGRLLMVGHVLRFWPEYVAIKEMIDDGRFGRARAATLRRVSGEPGWDAGWYADPSMSGSAAMDLHIHDVDAVRWWFGRATEVASTGVPDAAGASYISTQYRFESGPAVVAEGGWLSGQVPFAMSATVDFERATVVYDASATPTLRIYPESGEPMTPPVEPADAYRRELAHFVDCVSTGSSTRRASPEDALAAVATVEAELKSLRTGGAVKVP